MKKDKQDDAQRHAHRDAIIRAVFQQLVYHENYSYECAYIFIGDIWGLGRSKLTQIVNAKDDCPLTMTISTRSAYSARTKPIGERSVSMILTCFNTKR